MRAFMGLLGAVMIGLTSFSLGWEMKGQPKVISAIHQDYSLYDVYWQIEGEPPVALCRGPKMDHRMQFITCLMKKGTPAPWLVPSESKNPDPRMVGHHSASDWVVFVDLGRVD